MNNRIHRFRINRLSLLVCGVLFVFLTFGLKAANGNSNGNRTTIADFDGDGKTDISVFRPSDGYWYISKSSGGYSSIQWGISTDTPVPGDYDGDGKTDIAVHRQWADNTWYILQSSTNTFRAKAWGATNSEQQQQIFIEDRPIPGDYDGDGKTDLAVYRLTAAMSAPGRFVVLQSSTETGVSMEWGRFGDKIMPAADYDGDRKTDYTVYRNGIWYIFQSSNGVVRVERFGQSSDMFLPADYDNDGKADVAVWRPENGYWYWISSRNQSFNAIQFSNSSDRPTPGDYDGDGQTDMAVFRRSDGIWYLRQSSAGFRTERFGMDRDIPIPNVFVR